MYPGQPLGRDILGRAERLRQYTTTDALRFVRPYYRPCPTAVYVYGDVPFRTIVRTLERLTSDFGPAEPSLPAAQTVYVPDVPAEPLRIVAKQTHQAHVMVGGPAYGGGSPHRFALTLRHNILGGPGMNSRLTLSRRAKAGRGGSGGAGE